MKYDNIITITFDDGSGIVVRKGAADDWAAYYVDAGQDEQSGSLIKMSPYNTMWRIVDELVKESYPELTYRP